LPGQPYGLVKIETLTIPERERTFLFIKIISRVLFGFILLFWTKLWYAFNKLTLEGIVILNFLAIFLLAESKSAKVLTLALINSLIADSNLSMDKRYAQYLLNKTKNDYNLISEDFSRTRWNIWAEFNIFRDYVENGDKVLDVGCGNGRLLELLKDKNIDYIGSDVAEKLINIAKRKYPQNKFLVADARELSFPENSFDKVFLIAVLHSIPSEEFRLQILKKIREILKPGGLLILTVWDIWRKEAILLILKYLFLKLIGQSKLDFKDVFVAWADKTDRYYHFFTKKGLKNLVLRAGFKIERTGRAKNETGKRSNIYLVARKRP